LDANLPDTEKPSRVPDGGIREGNEGKGYFVRVA
jgi:hypothetical protein